MKWSRHIRLLSMVVVASARSLRVFGLFLCVFVWKMTKTQAVSRWSMLKTSRVFEEMKFKHRRWNDEAKQRCSQCSYCVYEICDVMVGFEWKWKIFIRQTKICEYGKVLRNWNLLNYKINFLWFVYMKLHWFILSIFFNIEIWSADVLFRFTYS